MNKPNIKHAFTSTNKRSQSIKESKYITTKPPVDVDLHNQTESSSPVDMFLKNFAQAVIFKNIPSKKESKALLFQNESDSTQKQIKHNPKQIVDIVKDVSMRNNYKIKDFGNNKFELKRENLNILAEIIQAHVREPKILKITLVSGNKQKATEFVSKILDDVEILEKSKIVKLKN